MSESEFWESYMPSAADQLAAVADGAESMEEVDAAYNSLCVGILSDYDGRLKETREAIESRFEESGESQSQEVQHEEQGDLGIGGFFRMIFGK